jgi:hypothetical protein
VEQKTSAAEKWLKITLLFYRRRTRRQSHLLQVPAGSNSAGDLSASRKTNNKAIFLTPFF